MIPVVRTPEPAALVSERDRALQALRALGRAPNSKDFEGYRVSANELWRAQHYKCCYCERKISESYNDVEHYRPKTQATRTPGSVKTHGYWWLAYTWQNLLFACPLCNRTGKNDLFPLRAGSVALDPEKAPPGREHPLLLDPAGTRNPAEHIQFIPAALERGASVHHWWARPRQGSLYGSWTIRVCGLNHSNLLELRGDHVEDLVRPRAIELREALRARDAKAVEDTLRRARALLSARSIFSLLSYDALRTLVPATLMRAHGLRWPDPAEIPIVR